MIIEYHRPKSIKDAILLLSRADPCTIVLGGGLYINEVVQEPIAVVDIQDLSLTGIENIGNTFRLGAAVKLQSLLDTDQLPPALVEAILHQETYNRRQVATLAGSLVAADGRSAIASVFLALDAELELVGSSSQKAEKHRLGDFLSVREEKLKGKVITACTIPANTNTAYHYVARSPADLPIIAAAVTQWPSGRTRVVLAGFGTQPVMVLDGTDSSGAELAARDAYSTAEDQWASADYRADTAVVLVRRCLNQIAENNQG